MIKLNNKNKALFKKVALGASVVGLGVVSFDALAAAQDLGQVASQITSSFTKVTQLVTGGSYLAGIAFAIGAIMKFKAHKDNPTQITIGTPIALLFVAAALLFLPSVLGVAGQTMFQGGGSVSGPKGNTPLSTQ